MNQFFRYMRFLSIACLSLKLTSCTSLLYHPNNIKYIDESRLKHKPQEVELQAGGQKDLLSWHFQAPPKNQKPLTLLFAHGNAQNISAHFRNLYWMLDHGFNFLIIGYPGFGPNTGTPTPRSTVDSVIAALKWIKKNRPEHKVILLGQSLGGNIALRALSEYSALNLCSAVIEGSFASYQSMGQNVLSRTILSWPFQWLAHLLLSDRYAISTNIQKLPSTHYLLIHGTNDKTIPLKFGRNLFEKIPHNTKTFWEVQEGGHMDTFRRFPAYQNKFLSYIEQHCK